MQVSLLLHSLLFFFVLASDFFLSLSLFFMQVDVAHFIGIQLAFPYKNKYCPHHQSDLPMKLHRTSWPGAAWFIKGLGRHQVEEMSEFPLKQPLVPLAQILTISEVAEPQLKNDVCGYLNRLRSSGFDPSHLLECVRRCGLTSALPGKAALLFIRFPPFLPLSPNFC